MKKLGRNVLRISRMMAAAGMLLAAHSACAQVVISEVYGGGGNAGATYRNDFVELFNRGSTTVSIGGWSVQYGSSSGTTWSAVAIPAGATLAPGQHYLVQLASGGAAGALLPAANATGAINLSATAGKVALCNNATVLSGACPSGAAIQDLVGYGAANCSEGASPAPGASNTTSVLRDLNGCDDTGINSANFTAGAPVPENTSTPLAPCGGGGTGTPLRIASWNVTGYVSNATRDPAFKTAIYGSFSGRSLAPDVLAAQEFGSSTQMNNFLTVLNTASGSPGDWAAAPFVDGVDLDNVFYYRTSRVTYVGTTVVAVGSTLATNQPRNTLRHDFRPLGLSGATNTIAVYHCHMKAGSAASDQSRRLVEAQRVRDNAEGVNTNGAGSGMPAGYNFMVVGDFNIQSSTQTAYAELIGSQANNAGRFFDPNNTPGSWNNNGAYKFIFTQEPIGDMDDRLDFMLISASLRNGTGIDYIGSSTLAFSTTTWNDPNHSFRVWGNDGSTFNTGIAVAGNTMVGATIAQALKDSVGGSATGGHLPIVANYAVPGAAFIMGGSGGSGADKGADTSVVSIDLGRVMAGREVAFPLSVGNDGNVAQWGADGIKPVEYRLESGEAAVPSGVFTARPGIAGNVHHVALFPEQAGLHSATVWVVEQHGKSEVIREVAFVMEVMPKGDVNLDETVDLGDIVAVVEAIAADDLQADVNADGVVDGMDLAAVIDAAD